MAHRPKVTLEELLRLKRAERPGADFWAGFERELRAKQLAALVRRPVWWSVSWARVRAVLLRVVAPLGATAAAVLTVMNYQGATLTSVPALATHPAVPALVAVATVAPAVPTGSAGEPAVVASAGPAVQPAAVVADASPVTAPTELEAPSGREVPAGSPSTLVVASSPAAFTTPWTRATDRAVEVDTVSLSAVPPSAGLGSAPLVELAPSLPDDNSAFAPLPAIRQLVNFTRSPEDTGRPAAIEAQAREAVSRRLTDNLLTGVSSRRMVDLEGSSVSVRF